MSCVGSQNHRDDACHTNTINSPINLKIQKRPAPQAINPSTHTFCPPVSPCGLLPSPAGGMGGAVGACVGAGVGVGATVGVTVGASVLLVAAGVGAMVGAAELSGAAEGATVESPGVPAGVGAPVAWRCRRCGCGCSQDGWVVGGVDRGVNR